MIGVGDSSGLNLLGSTAFTGGGTWQRYSYSFTEAAGAVRRTLSILTPLYFTWADGFATIRVQQTGMTGIDRERCCGLQAEPPSLVKGATAITANNNKSVRAFAPALAA